MHQWILLWLYAWQRRQNDLESEYASPEKGGGGGGGGGGTPAPFFPSDFPFFHIYIMGRG